MPPKKVPPVVRNCRGKISRFQKSIQSSLDSAQELFKKDALSPEDISKLSAVHTYLESDVKAYDDACVKLASILDPSTLESSDEAESDALLEFLFEAREVLKKVKFATQALPRQTSPDSKPSESERLTAELCCQMKDLLSIHKDTQMHTRSLLDQQMTASAQTNHRSTVNLPKLTIPTFTGDILKWAEFQDMYKSSVEDHHGLSDVQKFTYLREHLSGVAYETIAGLSVTESNYKIALGLLVERFGDKQVQINALHISLMDLPPSSNKTTSLRKFYDAVETHLRSLTALDEDVEQIIYVSLITSKISRHTMAQLELQKGTGPWSVTNLRSKLQAYISAQEAAERHSPNQVMPEKAPPPRAPQLQSNPARSSALLTTESRSAANPSPKSVQCAFCHGPHYSDECNKYTTVDTRKPQVGNRCFRCLRFGHTVHTCRANKPCFYCRRSDHHSSLCPSKFSSRVRPEAKPFQPSPAVNALAGEDKSVVMQTAVVQVISPDNPNSTTSARILFDTGSCRSYVSQSLQAQAKLQCLGQDSIALATFGSTSRNTTNYPRVEVNIKQNDSTLLLISANVIPKITAPIRRVSLNTCTHPSLRQLPLAEPLDSTSDRLEIDILIGLDHYYKIIGTDRIYFPDGLQLLHSSVGFVCAGTVDATPISPVQERNTALVVEPHRPFDPGLDLERFWVVEDIGISDSNEQNEDRLANDNFLQSITFDDNRYVVSWPWREPHRHLENNYSLAFGRLKSLMKRLLRDPSTLTKYNNVLEEQQSLGILEPVNSINTGISRVITFLREHLPIRILTTYLYSDSTTVLHWLKSDNLPVFVQNRVNSIQSVTDVTYQYVSTRDNPADLPSRGVTASSLSASKLWWHGPSLPVKSKGDASVHVAAGEGPSEGSSKGSGGQGIGHNSQANKKSEAPPFGMNVENFSSFDSLVRVSAFCFRFVSRLKKSKSFSGRLHPDELQAAEAVWIQHSQAAHYGDEIKALKHGKNHPLIAKLDPVLDEGLIRCRGRMTNADLCFNARFPVLVPRQHGIANLIVMDCHHKVMHAGVAHTLSRIRYQYWIPKGRAFVKSVLRKCQTCIKHDDGPYRTPAMSPLPASRVTQARPFSHVGVDYFGPVHVKSSPDTVKAWVCLFTCMVVRAVHLEIVSDMTPAEFLLSLRRFVARRGTPTVIISDNAPQFKLAKSVLDLAWENITSSAELLNYNSQHQIKWHFIVASSPWMGGFYERLVGVVKRALRKSIGRNLLTFNQWSTLLTEAEAVVNSRPLTYVDDDQVVTLTPASFVNSCGSTGFLVLPDATDPDFRPIQTSTSSLLDLWKKGQRRLDQFWKSWKDDYLLSLRETHTVNLRQRRILAPTSPAVGDVVLIKEDLPRANWRLGKIQEIHTSADDQVRSATVLTADRRLLKRPVSLLYPIEIQQDTVQSKTNEDPVASPPTRLDRPSRAAANASRSRLRELIDCGNV